MIFKKNQKSPRPRGGAQPHSVAFGGVFPNITEAILVNEISTKVRKKWSLNTKIYEFLMKRIGSPKHGNIRAFFAKCRESPVRTFRKKDPHKCP